MRALRWLWRWFRRFRNERGGRSPRHTANIFGHGHRTNHQIACPDCGMKVWCEVRLNCVTRYWTAVFRCPNCNQWCNASVRVPIHEFV